MTDTESSDEAPAPASIDIRLPAPCHANVIFKTAKMPLYNMVMEVFDPRDFFKALAEFACNHRIEHVTTEALLQELTSHQQTMPRDHSAGLCAVHWAAMLEIAALSSSLFSGADGSRHGAFTRATELHAVYPSINVDTQKMLQGDDRGIELAILWKMDVVHGIIAASLLKELDRLWEVHRTSPAPFFMRTPVGGIGIQRVHIEILGCNATVSVMFHTRRVNSVGVYKCDGVPRYVEKPLPFMPWDFVVHGIIKGKELFRIQQAILLKAAGGPDFCDPSVVYNSTSLVAMACVCDDFLVSRNARSPLGMDTIAPIALQDSDLEFDTSVKKTRKVLLRKLKVVDESTPVVTASLNTFKTRPTKRAPDTVSKSASQGRFGDLLAFSYYTSVSGPSSEMFNNVDSRRGLDVNDVLLSRLLVFVLHNALLSFRSELSILSQPDQRSGKYRTIDSFTLSEEFCQLFEVGPKWLMEEAILDISQNYANGERSVDKWNYSLRALAAELVDHKLIMQLAKCTVDALPSSPENIVAVLEAEELRVRQSEDGTNDTPLVGLWQAVSNATLMVNWYRRDDDDLCAASITHFVANAAKLTVFKMKLARKIVDEFGSADLLTAVVSVSFGLLTDRTVFSGMRGCTLFKEMRKTLCEAWKYEVHGVTIFTKCAQPRERLYVLEAQTFQVEVLLRPTKELTQADFCNTESDYTHMHNIADTTLTIEETVTSIPFTLYVLNQSMRRNKFVLMTYAVNHIFDLVYANKAIGTEHYATYDETCGHAEWPYISPSHSRDWHLGTQYSRVQPFCWLLSAISNMTEEWPQSPAQAEVFWEVGSKWIDCVDMLLSFTSAAIHRIICRNDCGSLCALFGNDWVAMISLLDSSTCATFSLRMWILLWAMIPTDAAPCAPDQLWSGALWADKASLGCPFAHMWEGLEPFQHHRAAAALVAHAYRYGASNTLRFYHNIMPTAFWIGAAVRDVGGWRSTEGDAVASMDLFAIIKPDCTRLIDSAIDLCRKCTTDNAAFNERTKNLQLDTTLAARTENPAHRRAIVEALYERQFAAAAPVLQIQMPSEIKIVTGPAADQCSISQFLRAFGSHVESADKYLAEFHPINYRDVLNQGELVCTIFFTTSNLHLVLLAARHVLAEEDVALLDQCKDYPRGADPADLAFAACDEVARLLVSKSPDQLLAVAEELRRLESLCRVTKHIADGCRSLNGDVPLTEGLLRIGLITQKDADALRLEDSRTKKALMGRLFSHRCNPVDLVTLLFPQHRGAVQYISLDLPACDSFRIQGRPSLYHIFKCTSAEQMTRFLDADWQVVSSVHSAPHENTSQSIRGLALLQSRRYGVYTFMYASMTEWAKLCTTTGTMPLVSVVARMHQDVKLRKDINHDHVLVLTDTCDAESEASTMIRTMLGSRGEETQAYVKSVWILLPLFWVVNKKQEVSERRFHTVGVAYGLKDVVAAAGSTGVQEEPGMCTWLSRVLARIVNTTRIETLSVKQLLTLARILPDVGAYTGVQGKELKQLQGAYVRSLRRDVAGFYNAPPFRPMLQTPSQSDIDDAFARFGEVASALLSRAAASVGKAVGIAMDRLVGIEPPLDPISRALADAQARVEDRIASSKRDLDTKCAKSVAKELELCKECLNDQKHLAGEESVQILALGAHVKDLTSLANEHTSRSRKAAAIAKEEREAEQRRRDASKLEADVVDQVERLISIVDREWDVLDKASRHEDKEALYQRLRTTRDRIQTELGWKRYDVLTSDERARCTAALSRLSAKREYFKAQDKKRRQGKKVVHEKPREPSPVPQPEPASRSEQSSSAAARKCANRKRSAAVKRLQRAYRTRRSNQIVTKWHVAANALVAEFRALVEAAGQKQAIELVEQAIEEVAAQQTAATEPAATQPAAPTWQPVVPSRGGGRGRGRGRAGRAALHAARVEAPPPVPPPPPINHQVVQLAQLHTLPPTTSDAATEVASTVNDSSTCAVCLEKRRTHVAIPCGHMCVCAKCSKTNLVRSKCPICRVAVEKWIRVHMC